MIQTGYGFGFSLESLSAPGIRGELRQNLDGDGALQPRVSRTVDLTHPAHTEQRENLIRSQTRCRGQCHGGADYTRTISPNCSWKMFCAFDQTGRRERILGRTPWGNPATLTTETI